MQLGSTFNYLGFLMSVMVAAPVLAIKREFYFPLLAVYSKWCVALARRRPTELSLLLMMRERGRK